MIFSEFGIYIDKNGATEEIFSAWAQLMKALLLLLVMEKCASYKEIELQ